MPASFDTDVLLYVASGNSAKSNAAEKLVRAGGIISVQVLHKIANISCSSVADHGLSTHLGEAGTLIAPEHAS